MGRPRLSLASLMGLVAVIALGLAGLFSASTFRTAAAATVTLMLMLGAVLGTILPRSPEWAFCIGFALFGEVYFVVVEWDWDGGQLGHDLTAGLVDPAESMIPSPVVATRSIALGLPIPVPMETLAARQIRVGNFVQISRMALALCFALAGGCLGRLFNHRQHGLPGQGHPVTS